jgi:hypothetical protein
MALGHCNYVLPCLRAILMALFGHLLVSSLSQGLGLIYNESEAFPKGYQTKALLAF